MWNSWCSAELVLGSGGHQCEKIDHGGVVVDAASLSDIVDPFGQPLFLGYLADESRKIDDRIMFSITAGQLPEMFDEMASIETAGIVVPRLAARAFCP